MKLALVYGVKSQAVANTIKKIKDNIDIDCFNDIPEFIDITLKRRIMYDRLLMPTTAINENALDDLKQFWSGYMRNTSIVLLCRQGVDDNIGHYFASHFVSPNVCAMFVEQNKKTGSLLTDAILMPMQKLNDNYGLKDILKVQLEDEGQELNLEQPVEQDKEQVEQVANIEQFSQPNEEQLNQSDIVQNKLEDKPKKGFGLFGRKNKKQKNVNQPINNQGIVNNGMPNNGMPNNGMPNNGMPNQGMPNNVMNNQGMPNNDMYNQGMPNNDIYNQGMPNNVMNNQGIANNGMPNNSMPNNSMPNNSMPNNVMHNQGMANNNGMSNNDMNNGVHNKGTSSQVMHNHNKLNRGVSNQVIQNQENFEQKYEEIPNQINDTDFMETPTDIDYAKDFENSIEDKIETNSTIVEDNIETFAYNENNLQEGLEDEISEDLGNLTYANDTETLENANENIVGEVSEDLGDLTYVNDTQPIENNRNVSVSEVSEDLGDIDLGSAENAYREINETPKVITKEVVREVIRDTGGSSNLIKSIADGKNPSVVVVTGDRGTGITSTCLSIASFFCKTTSVLYFDCDVDNHGLLNYINYEEFRDFEPTKQSGVKICKSGKVFRNCVCSFDDNLDILSTDFSVEVTDSELECTAGVVAEKVVDYGLVIVDCPASKLHCISDLLLSGNTIICVDSSKRGFMNMLCSLESSTLSLRYKKLMVNKGIMFLTKYNKDIDIKRIVNYVKSIYEPEGVDWLAMHSLPFNGKIDSKILSRVFTK